MPITFGECAAGEWPASVPAEATLKGVLVFLPNTNRFEVQRGMKQAILAEGSEWLRQHFELTFPMLNSDRYSLAEDHPLVVSMVAAARRNGAPGVIQAMTAACDAWFYNNQAEIPTLVFGPGSLRHAHSKDEQIRIDDIMTAASILADFAHIFGAQEGSDA
jgi:acetylornithine deacetylase